MNAIGVLTIIFGVGAMVCLVLIISTLFSIIKTLKEINDLKKLR